MDQYLHVQSLVGANFNRSVDITLNGSIFAHSKSCRCKFHDIITLNGSILARSKSHRCKFRHISRHHIE
uniref:Uncharacterized protein n=1 Tax=viral metagenome TaxID=1070528 RepID=A0A6C0CCQ8_9ZZZZ